MVQEIGRISRLEAGGMTRLEISAGKVAGEADVGDSVSVNGTCLTVSDKSELEGTLFFYAMHETLRRSALGDLAEGSLVNLELALGVGDRFGGHIVQGHVDGVGEVLSVRLEGNAEIWEFAAPESVLRYTVEKGSICVDGISLTVVSVEEGSFTVSILPQTRESTNLRERKIRDRVNLEADVIGKYVERLLGPRVNKSFERSV